MMRRLGQLFSTIVLSPLLFLAAGNLCASALQRNAAPDKATEAPTPLETGKPILRSLTGKKIYRYQLTLQEGQCASIEVEQRGVDVAVQLLGNDNGVQAEADDRIGLTGTERLEIVADRSAEYTIAVNPKWMIGSGAYQIRLVAVRPATALDRKLDEIRRLQTHARQLDAVDNPRESLPLAQRALTMAQESLSADDVYVALLTADVANMAFELGKPDEALATFDRALQVLNARLGADDPQTISVKIRMGAVCVFMEQFPTADRWLGQALESEKKTFAGDSPLLAAILKSMAIMDRMRGDTSRAEDENLRALAILDRLGLSEQATYGELLNNLGLLYKDFGNLEKAQKYLELTLAFDEKHYGLDSPNLSKTLNNLGIAARQRKDYPAAEKYFQRALAIKEKNLGPQHPEYAAVLMNLANVYASEGEFAKALDLHLRALKIYESDLGPGEFAPIISLANVAKNYAAIGDFANANRYQARVEAAVEDDISLNLALGSERQKLAYLGSMAQRTERAVSLNLQLEPGDSQAAATAVTALLQRKGRILDATTDTLAALRKHSSPQDQALLDQYRESNVQLARVALTGPSPQQSPEQYHKSLRELQEKKEALENTITHHSEEFRAQSQPVTLDAVLTAIPYDAALVEFVTYRPFNPEAPTDAEQWSELHYGVYVLHHNGSIKSVDLGPAKTIDRDIQSFREALRDPGSADVRRFAHILSTRVFLPIQSMVAGDKRLLISPDGQLDLIPFEALMDDRERYLVENFPITYLTAGRDLLRLQVPRSSKGAPVIVADPFFGEPDEVQVASAGQPPAMPGRPENARRSITSGTDISSLYFAPLAATRGEADSIHSLFPEAHILTGKSASETAIEQLIAPKILHIATHGFFLEDLGNKSSSRAQGKKVAPDDEVDNPLLRSGLALSGANLARRNHGEGILTALEASNLDLWGTRLVTLSACDTGVGEVKNGQGVYGLRRSFFLAGAETLVMSLWPVSDYVAREMMTAYYTGLKKGLGRGDALRQAQLAMIRRKDRNHPFYWASFIQSGEWANLDGKR